MHYPSSVPARQALPPAIFLMGPTATGKTDIAVDLVQRRPFDIISVDSALIYRGMDIGTAKPAMEVLAQAPHALMDIRDPVETYSAAQFREDALREMARISSEGRIPLLVGGTMLYYQALRRGLSPLPSANPELRAQLAAEAKDQGWHALHQRLAAVDPPAAARIHPNDPQRIQRALEVYELTGQPLSRLQAASAKDDLPYRVINLVVSLQSRADLHRRIEARFDGMLQQGLVEEVEGLAKRWPLHGQLPAMRALGYRQVWSYLRGELSYQPMREHAVYATRQLAKRQLTWLNPLTDAVWFHSDGKNISTKILKYLDERAML